MAQNPSNLPSRINRIYAFKDHDLVLKLNFIAGYDITGLSVKLFYKDKFHAGLAEITTSSQLATVTLSKNDFLSINLPVFELFVYNNQDISILGATVEVSTKPGNPVLETFNINLIEGEIINVSVVDAQASIDASELAIQAATDAIQANEEAQAIVPTLQTDINGRIPLSQKGIANGVGTLGSDLLQPISEVKPYYILQSNTQSVIPLTSVQKTGANSYYGLKSQYTSDPINVVRATTKLGGSAIVDSDVDNIIFFKFSDGTYGKRSTPSLNFEEFGATGDGINNDTSFIQSAIDKISLTLRGGVVNLKSATYLVNGFSLKPRVAIRGEGDSTIIKLANGANSDVISVPVNSFLNELSGFIIDGNKSNNTIGSGIKFIAATNTDGTPYNAMIDKSIQRNAISKFSKLYNVKITNCKENGLSTGANYFWEISGIQTCRNDGHGVFNAMNDCIFSNIFSDANGLSGIRDGGNNNKWSNLKLIFNGFKDPFNSAGLNSTANRSSYVNVESQDNNGHGFIIANSRDTSYENLIADSNGNWVEFQGSGYTPTRGICGFKITNSRDLNFTDCKALNNRPPYTDVVGDPYFGWDRQDYPYNIDDLCANIQGEIIFNQHNLSPIQPVATPLKKEIPISVTRGVSVDYDGVTYPVGVPAISSNGLNVFTDIVRFHDSVLAKNCISLYTDIVWKGITNLTSGRMIETDNGALRISASASGLTFQVSIGGVAYTRFIGFTLVLDTSYRIGMRATIINGQLLLFGFIAYADSTGRLFLTQSALPTTTVSGSIDPIINLRYNGSGSGVGRVGFIAKSILITNEYLPEYIFRLGSFSGRYLNNAQIFQNWTSYRNFIIDSVSVLPTACEFYRGRKFILLGANGISDQIYHCIKNSSDLYVWVVSPLLISNTATYNPPSIAVGSYVTTNVSVLGALLGMQSYASFSIDLTNDITIHSRVSASDTVTVTFRNIGVSAVDLASGTLTVRVG